MGGGGAGGLEDQIDRGRLGRAQWAGKLVVVMVVAAVMAVGGG
jgi:LPS O-antigen subunit length determinant protein (WzzB/FepE family)